MTRAIRRELWIGADPETVWRAFTEAEQIVNWFATRAESAPGVGGFITLSWGAELDALEGPTHCHILEWEPGRRLLMTWRDAPGGEHELPVELTLQARDGGTLLRLVHAGFLSDASWDDEYESHGRGWTYELRSLKHYLESCLGRRRSSTLTRYPVPGGQLADAWRAVVGPSGIFRVLDEVAEGVEVLIDLPTGQSTRASMLVALEERDFVAVAELLQGGIFRLALEVFSGTPEIWVWAHSWQLSDAELKLLMAPVYRAIRGRLAGS